LSCVNASCQFNHDMIQLRRHLRVFVAVPSIPIVSASATNPMLICFHPLLCLLRLRHSQASTDIVRAVDEGVVKPI